MRSVRVLIPFLFVVTLAMFTESRVAAQNNAAVEQQIRDLITQFTNAYGVNDLDKYFSYYADDMTWWGPNGNRNEADGNKPKANYQKLYPDSVKRSGGLAGSKVTDLRVQVSPQGDAAIASYRLDVTRKNLDPARPPTIVYEMTAGLFKRGNDWKIVHFHYQTIPPPKPTTQP